MKNAEIIKNIENECIMILDRNLEELNLILKHPSTNVSVKEQCETAIARITHLKNTVEFVTKNCIVVNKDNEVVDLARLLTVTFSTVRNATVIINNIRNSK